MATHSSTLAWKILWTEEPGGRVYGVAKSRDMTEQLHLHFSLSCTGEGNGNPLQCSCLENPSDGGAWWAAVHGVTQSWTGLKWLSSSSSSSCYLFLLFLLKFNWLTTICSFQAWNILIRHFYRLCTKVITMLLTLFPVLYITHPYDLCIL